MKAKKRFGQNFLIDNNITNKINDEIIASENDLIIEIGPGMGALTRYLKSKKTHLICYEIDTEMKEYLDPLEDDKTKIIYQDVLTSNIKEDIKDIKYNKLIVVGNLPYYITSPIIKRLIEIDEIDSMYFMVQEEVADRFSSKPDSKDYGSMTLFINYYYNVSKLFKVSKNSFRPIPKVESAIIKLTKRINRPEVNKEKYFKLIMDSFQNKRKTLKNNLKDYDFNKIIEVLKTYAYHELVRAEELKEDVFVEIYKALN